MPGVVESPGTSRWLLRPDECALELRCSRSTVYGLISSGWLPASRRGSGPRARLLVSRDDLDAAVERWRI